MWRQANVKRAEKKGLLYDKTKQHIRRKKKYYKCVHYGKIKGKKEVNFAKHITDSLKREFNKADTKEKEVLKKVATNDIANKYKSKTAISNVLEIQDFFEREDVSRPIGEKRVHNEKQKRCKRYLMEPIYKLYRKYRLQDRNTCAYIKHSNLSFKAISLKKLGLLQTSDIDELMKNDTCSKCFICIYSECSECKNKKLAVDLTINEDSPVELLQWKMGKKYSKQVVKGTVNTMIKEFQNDVQKFKTHYYNVQHQYLAWKKCIENLDEDKAALICDFSEIFSCKQSEEIQAVHFEGSRNQVTLHTCVHYRKSVKPQSKCSISPNNEHDPGAIWAHLDPIMKLTAKNIFFFLFQHNIKEYGFEYATWNFFETSHGKGPAEGVGRALMPLKLKMFYVNENDIQKMTKNIPENIIITIKGTMKLHQILLTPFVCKRINEIKQEKDIEPRNVNSELNPADPATRPEFWNMKRDLGIRGKPHEWFQSYLSTRFLWQHVCENVCT
ncbi:hypothetical protein ABMA28_003529 [Loxostege sticticalis]|uniref:Uncharacterized protein n=1 Tax=Loxostege sticticalis TaxID=481309 RepID=A0ABD0SYW0_LOXSC